MKVGTFISDIVTTNSIVLVPYMILPILTIVLYKLGLYKLVTCYDFKTCIDYINLCTKMNKSVQYPALMDTHIQFILS